MIDRLGDRYGLKEKNLKNEAARYFFELSKIIRTPDYFAEGTRPYIDFKKDALYSSIGLYPEKNREGNIVYIERAYNFDKIDMITMYGIMIDKNKIEKLSQKEQNNIASEILFELVMAGNPKEREEKREEIIKRGTLSHRIESYRSFKPCLFCKEEKDPKCPMCKGVGNYVVTTLKSSRKFN